MRSLVLCLALGCLSLSVFAAPTFTDQSVEAGHLNPGDTEIAVQTVRVTGDSTHATDFNAIQIRNGGTATYQQITRIEVRDGGTTIAAMDTPIGLTSQSGVTIATTHSLPAGDTEDLRILVWVGDTSAVQGGETLQFEVRFHYYLNGTAGTSRWIADGQDEDITHTGFENINDSSPAANNYNPGDEGTVQRVSFRDEDANTSDQTVTTVLIQNTGTATADDLESLTVAITHGGGTWQETKTTGLAAWKNGGIVFDPPDILIGDEDQLTVEVDVEIAAPTPTVPTDNHTIRTRTTLNVTENAQAFSQEVVASTTQRIRKAGLEEVEDDSTIPPSGVLNPNETLTQKIIVRDRDINAERVNVTRLWVRNLGTAAETEIERIIVRSGGAPLGTFTGAQIAPFLTGVWLDITDVLVANEGDRTFFIEYEIASSQTLQPQVKLECNEDGNVYTTLPVDYPAPVTLYGAGLEILENENLTTETVYSFQRFCAQKIRMEDLDENTNSVTVNPVVCKNQGTAADSEIARIEVRNADGALLGETTEIGGFNAGGVTIPTLSNNAVSDDSEGYLWIWVTLAGTEDTVAGHTVELQTTVFHTEGGTSYNRAVQGNPWTIALNNRPVPDFTFEEAAAPASVRPMADFTYEDTIQFNGTATDPDGDDIVEWHWDFGDGNTSDEQNPTHQYPNGGTFDVTLTVTDEHGVTGSVTKTIEVEGPPNEEPTIDELTADPENPAVDQDVEFAVTVTDPDQPAGTAFGYEWDFGDEATSTVANPTHSYDEEGTYTVTVTVTDAQGATDTATIDVTVGNDPPTLTGVTANPATAGTGDEVAFTATGYDDPDDDAVGHYEWDFDDGTTTETDGATANHIFATPGTYTVSVVAVDERGTESAAVTVQVTVTGPARTILFAFPNPAETNATFNYFLPDGATDPVLRIYGLLGELVFEQELQEDGTPFVWDLRTAGGDRLPNGLYFCVVTVTGANRSAVFRLLIDRQ